jgi:hypothetical protein
MSKDPIKIPEMRQPRLSKNYLEDNYRPSGLSNGPRVVSKNQSGRRLFVYQTNPAILPNGAIKRWIILSSGRRSVLIRYLFLKLVYDELTRSEMAILLSFNESTTIKSIFYALKARTLGIHKKLIRKILEAVTIDPNFPSPTREEYLGIKQIHLSISEKVSSPIEKPKPYSGYSKGYKDGQRRSKFQIDEFSSSPLEPSPLFEDEIKILIDFTVEISHTPRKLTGYLNSLKGESYELE